MSARASDDARIVPARQAALLVQRARNEGLPSTIVLSNTGLSEADLATTDGRIGRRQLERIYENLLRAGASWLGLRNDASFAVRDYGLLGYAMLSCETLRQAINIAERYYRTAGPMFELRFVEREGEFVIEAANVLKLRPNVLTVVIEDLFGAFPDLLAMLLGRRVHVVAVEVDYPAPDYAPIYRERFQCPIRFNAERNAFRIERSLLDANLAQADADSAALLEQSCRELLRRIEGESNTSSAVRKRLLTATRTNLSADEIASSMNIGVRTLRRRLKAEGTSYQSLLDDVRTRLAIDYLRETDLSTQQIGELLGFTEATNFRRAFIRWTKRTPKSYRPPRR